MENIAEKFKKIVVKEIGCDESEVTPSASFLEDLGFDSLDGVEVVMACEEAFEIEIPDEDVDGITTVKQAVEYLERRLGQKK
jgi:acyl carrier protein